MAKDRAKMKKLALALGLLLPFALAFCLSVELWLRTTTNLPYVSRTLCFTQNALEAPGFVPNCEETMPSPAGSVLFRTNELGLRERPLSFFEKGATALLGDSFAEGFWVPEEKALARALEKEWKPAFPILNLGIRASGPSQQAVRLYRAWEKVPVRAILWFLNPSDPIDELNFQARNPGFRIARSGWLPLRPIWDPSSAYWAVTRASIFFHDKIYLLLYIAERWIKQAQQAREVAGAEFKEEVHCRTLREVAAEAKKQSIPLSFVAMPHGRPQELRPYFGGFVSDQLFERLLACARSTGARVLDLRVPLEGASNWYWKNDWHYNERGSAEASAILARALREAK